MQNQELKQVFEGLSTALICDACLKLELPIRAQSGLRSAAARILAGRVLPARHYGSVDIFLEALEGASPGDILVIDNQGRMDEACIGDLIALEAQAAGLGGILVWGAHRDSRELAEIGLAVFSRGVCPNGPQRLEAREPEALSCLHLPATEVRRADCVFADEDGAVFVASDVVQEVLAAARAIARTERGQATLVRAGTSLREQFLFSAYLERRSKEPGHTLGAHLREIGAAIGE